MSEQEIFFVVVGGIVAGAAILLLIFARVRTDAAEDAWRKFADRHGLRYDTQHGEKKTLAVHGEMDGHAILVERVEIGGQSKSYQTHITVELQGRLPEGMTLGPERFGKGFLKRAFAGEDVEIGERDFDEHVFVRAENPAQVKTYLSDERRTSVRRLVELKATVEDRKIFLKLPKPIAKISDLENLYEELGQAAKVLSTR